MIIQTHNGKIHSSECVSIALLTNYYAKKDQEVKVARSRGELKSDVLIDVGCIYDFETLRFDYHQEDFCEKWPKSEILLSSAGLIWRHFGKELLQMYLEANFEDFDHNSDETLEELQNIIYFKLFLEIDANANNLSIGNGIDNLNIPNIVKAINSDDTSNDEIQNNNFYKAIHLIAEIFDIKFREIINNYFNFSRDLQIVKRCDLSSPYIIVEENIPTIFKCLNTLNSNVKFVIFTNDDDEYTVKTRRNGHKYNPICPISQDISSKLTKPEDLIFVHKACFLAKCSTLETAKEIVSISLAESEHGRIREIYQKLKISQKLNKEKIGVLGLGIASIGLSCYYIFNRD